MLKDFLTSFFQKKQKNKATPKGTDSENIENHGSILEESKQPESETVINENDKQDSSVPEKKKNNKKKKKKKKKNAWLSLLIKLGIIAAVVFVASFFVKIELVHSNSMFPSFRDGDLVITTSVLKYSFNDVVVYKTHGSTGTEKHMGRIMCLENNEVELDEYNNFKVNGNIISTNEFYKEYERGSLKYPYQVEPNHYFILQDYRVEVDDSRIYGAIDKKDITGKVIFTFRIRGF